MFSMLITEFVIDIKLQKRWFPAPDLWVRLTGVATAATVARRLRIDVHDDDDDDNNGNA